MNKRSTIKNTGIAIAWSKVHRRTEWLTELLKLKLIKFEERPPYLRSFKNTIKSLTNSKNDIILIQGTHGPLALLSTSFQNTSRYISLIDLHSGFIIPSSWKSFLLTLPFRNTLNKFDIIITHNEHIIKLLPKQAQKNTITVYDPPLEYSCKTKMRKENFIIVFPSGGLPDEPIQEVTNEFNKKAKHINAVLYVTGPHEPRKIGNVIYTGFLPRNSYLNLLCNADIVLALTSREYTVVGAAWEALYLNIPMILSMTNTLHTIFQKAGIFIKDAKELVDTIIELYEDQDKLLKYKEQAKLLSMHYRKIQTEQTTKLIELIENHLNNFIQH
jgi:glycosyltransferase involved in cell wall biosynthesis